MYFSSNVIYSNVFTESGWKKIKVLISAFPNGEIGNREIR